MEKKFAIPQKKQFNTVKKIQKTNFAGQSKQNNIAGHSKPKTEKQLTNFDKYQQKKIYNENYTECLHRLQADDLDLEPSELLSLLEVVVSKITLKNLNNEAIQRILESYLFPMEENKAQQVV